MSTFQHCACVVSVLKLGHAMPCQGRALSVKVSQLALHEQLGLGVTCADVPYIGHWVAQHVAGVTDCLWQTAAVVTSSSAALSGSLSLGHPATVAAAPA